MLFKLFKILMLFVIPLTIILTKEVYAQGINGPQVKSYCYEATWSKPLFCMDGQTVEEAGTTPLMYQLFHGDTPIGVPQLFTSTDLVQSEVDGKIVFNADITATCLDQPLDPGTYENLNVRAINTLGDRSGPSNYLTLVIPDNEVIDTRPNMETGENFSVIMTEVISEPDDSPP